MQLFWQMLQRTLWNVQLRIHRRPATLLCVLLVVLFGLPASTPADTPIFKYEDDLGIITFTEQWDTIPGKYRERVVTLNSTTLKPVERGSSPHRPHASQPIADENPKDSVWLAWRDKLDGFSIPLPTQFQLGVGLTSGVLIVGTLVVRRYTKNPFMRVLLNLVAVILLGGTVYVLYFFRLNAEVSSLSGEPRQRTITGSDLKQTANTTRAAISETIQRSVVHPLQSIVEQSKDATLGDASRTVDRANAATTQMENGLKEIGREEGHADAQ